MNQTLQNRHQVKNSIGVADSPNPRSQVEELSRYLATFERGFNRHETAGLSLIRAAVIALEREPTHSSVIQIGAAVRLIQAAMRRLDTELEERLTGAAALNLRQGK